MRGETRREHVARARTYKQGYARVREEHRCEKEDDDEDEEEEEEEEEDEEDEEDEEEELRKRNCPPKGIVCYTITVALPSAARSPGVVPPTLGWKLASAPTSTTCGVRTTEAGSDAAAAAAARRKRPLRARPLAFVGGEGGGGGTEGHALRSSGRTAVYAARVCAKTTSKRQGVTAA